MKTLTLKQRANEKFGTLKDFIKFDIESISKHSDYNKEYSQGERYYSSKLFNGTFFKTKKEAVNMFREKKQDFINENL